MKNTELGPAARSPTDSEEVAKLKGELTRAAESMGDAVALHTHIHRLTEALKSASVALNVCQGWLLGLGKQREAADADRWRDEAYQAALPQTCPVCGEGRHDGTCIDLALGEARGTASASESLDKTQNSEHVALRASVDGTAGHTPGPWVLVHDVPYEASIEAAGERVPGLDLWLDDACFDLNDLRLANGRLAAAAPDLLRENARLREEVEQAKKQIAKDSWLIAYATEGRDAAKKELTRARAAHLENAELLAKAQGRAERAAKAALQRADDAETKADAARGDPERAQESFAKSIAAITWQAAADLIRSYFDLPSDDRKGEAAQPPRVASDDPYWNGRCGVITHLAYGCPDPKGHGGDHSRVLLKAPSGPAAPAKEREP